MPGKPETGAAPAPHGSFRFNLLELGGALGDLGTLLPLIVALITLNHMNSTSVFLVLAVAYIASGAFYRLPIPVQPLKAVAAIAIARGISADTVSASGLVMAVFLLFMAGTGAIDFVGRFFPKVVVRGIQLGVGLLLVKAGLVLVSSPQVIMGAGEASSGLASPPIPINWILALLLGGIFLLLLRSNRWPASLVVLGLGVFAGVFWGSISGLSGLHFGLSLPKMAVPSLGNLSAALVLLVIPQIPQTLGNAVFATADTAKTYFGPKARRVTPRALLTTAGVANLGAGLLGGIPICHGSGGLTAHFRMGARTGGAGIMIGALFLVLALLLDGHVLPLLSLIPYPVLGVLVAYVGVRHSVLVRDLRGRDEIFVALLVGIVGLVTANLTIGWAAGVSIYLAMRMMSRSRLATKGPPESSPNKG